MSWGEPLCMTQRTWTLGSPCASVARLLMPDPPAYVIRASRRSIKPARISWFATADTMSTAIATHANEAGPAHRDQGCRTWTTHFPTTHSQSSPNKALKMLRPAFGFLWTSTNCTHSDRSAKRKAAAFFAASG